MPTEPVLSHASSTALDHTEVRGEDVAFPWLSDGIFLEKDIATFLFWLLFFLRRFQVPRLHLLLKSFQLALIVLMEVLLWLNWGIKW